MQEITHWSIQGLEEIKNIKMDYCYRPQTECNKAAWQHQIRLLGARSSLT